MVLRFLVLFFFASGFFSAFAAVNCTLDHPDQDVKRLYPQSTRYRVRELIPTRHGPKDLRNTLLKLLESELDKEYETADTPYTFYVVYESSRYAGLILGVNVRAIDGPMQIFAAYEPNGKIKDIYVQKISSKDASAFRSKFYREQYRRFGVNRLFEAAEVKPPQRIPSPETIKDHQHFMRGVRLNILLVKYLYNPFRE